MNIFVPKVSIITINYNNATGLQKTIKSVIYQTSKDFEYIIIDGGSKDGSVEVIKSFTKISPGAHTYLSEPEGRLKGDSLNRSRSSPIVYWISEPDKGIYHAMNKGLHIAEGEYVQFINSGDCLSANDVIEKMLNSLPDCSIFYGNMLKILPNGKIIRDRCEAGNISMLSFFKGSLNHAPAFIKKSMFEKYGLYDETLKIVSDWKFYLTAVGLNDEPVSYIDLDVAWFDMQGISNTNKNLLNKEREFVLNTLLPKSILIDYHGSFENIMILQRFRKNKTIWFIIHTLYRILSRADVLFLKRSYERNNA